jgi:hypothetical protein
MQVLLLSDGLLGADSRKRLPFAVAGHLRYKCGSVRIERAHNMVARFRNYRTGLILQRRDFIGGSIFKVNCDWHDRLTSLTTYSSLTRSRAGENLIDPNQAPIQREANMRIFGSLQVSFFAAFCHRFVTFGADWLPRTIRVVAVGKFDSDHHHAPPKEVRSENGEGWIG